MTLPKVKEIMNKDVEFYANLGSPSANWYLQATDLIPHGVTKHTPRELAVIIHRLRLGYKANWQIVEGVERPCEYCEEDTEHPLLHYLLECPNTAQLRGNGNLPRVEHPNSVTEAARLCKQLVENIERYERTLIEYPPPR